MKKSISQAVTRGLAVLALMPAAHTAFAGVDGGLEYRVAWDQADNRYRVYARPTSTPSPDLSMTGQVTLRVPHHTGPDKFTVADIQAKSGTSWSLSSEVYSPTEDRTVDYLSFTYTPIDVRAFAFKANTEQEIFSFRNTGPCMGSVELMNNATDPFNQPPSAPANSAGTNPGNQFANAGWGATDDNDYLGNYGSAADCAATSSNTAPDLTDDTASTTASSSVIVDVLANDADADGDTLAIDSYTQGSNGTVAMQDGKPMYTPNAGFSGTDSFSYTVTDGKDTATATVTITVTGPGNTAPSVIGDSATTTEDNAVGIDVLANDTDADGDALSIDSFANGSNGTVSEDAGMLVYTPNSGFSGSDSFTYAVTDGTDISSGTVNITVEAKTGGLQANTDTFTVNSNGGENTFDVIANDNVPGDASITIEIITAPAHGTASVQDGKILYVPNSNYSGTDTLVYRITDADGNRTEANITVTVKAEPVSCATAPANPEADKVYYRVGWSNVDQRYHVYMYSETPPSPNQMTSAQVTLKVPFPAEGNQFAPTDVQSSFSGIVWSNNSSVHGPSEDPTSSYLSFTPAISNPAAIQWKAGEEIEVFSFANNGACAGEVTLIDNGSDPFNQPPAAPENSVGTNPGNSLSNIGLGGVGDDDYGGNYGCPAVCTASNTDQDSDSDGLADAEEAMLGTDPNSADSDQDGVPDKDEVGADANSPQDTDNDGTIDALDTDDDNDGLLTRRENYAGTPQTTDSDGDGRPDYLDKDDDNDGIPTASEQADNNNDGAPDDAVDTDNNSKPDYLDSRVDLPSQTVAVPTLTQWAQILLSLLLGGVALRKYLRLRKD